MGILTLRRRLTLLVALAIVVPITVVGVMVVNLIGGEGDARIFDRLRLTAGFAATSLSADRDRLSGAAERIAADPGVAAAVAAADPDLERRLVAALDAEGIDAVVVTDAAGEVIGGISRAPDGTGADAPTLDDLVADSPPDLALRSRAAAAFGTVHTIRWIDRSRLEALTRSESTALSLLSPGGDLIASTQDIGTVPAEVGGEFRARFGAEERFAVSAEVPGSDSRLLASSLADAGRSRESLVAILGLLLLVLLVLVVLIGFVVSGLVTRPVNDLVDAALAVAKGDLSKRVDVRGDEEIVALGRAFNQMTDNLQEYVAQLQQSRADFQSAIGRLGDVLVATHDISGIVDVVLEAATLTLRADLAVFYERVAMPARIRASAARRGTGGADTEVDLPDLELNGTGVAGAAAKDLMPITFPGNGWLDLAEPVVASAMAVPVVADGRLFGVLAVYGRAHESLFSADDVDTLQTLGRQTEVAIGNVQLHDETRRQARTDGLTGLWNRREFELRAREKVTEAARYEEPLGVVLVDIDNFKLVNDRFDHSTGDAALIWVASRLAEATRESDTVARWGGEEFIILLPRQGLDETAAVAERVRAAVAREPMVEGGKIIPITVSIGFSVRPHDGDTADELFKSADTALLTAKRTGKNRVHHAGADEGVA